MMAVAGRSGRVQRRNIPGRPPTPAGRGPVARAGHSCQEYSLIKDSCYKLKVFLPDNCEWIRIQYVVVNQLRRTRCAPPLPGPIEPRIRRRTPVIRRLAAERLLRQRLGL